MPFSKNWPNLLTLEHEPAEDLKREISPVVVSPGFVKSDLATEEDKIG